MKKIKDKQNPVTAPEVKAHHDSPALTRREFLSRGLIAGSGFVGAPSLLTLLAQKAYGQDLGIACPEPQVSNMIPAFFVDLSGGANLAGSNFIVGGQNGQLDFLGNYSGMGVTAEGHPSNSGMVNSEYGIAMHSFSGFLAGLNSYASPSARACVDGFVLAGISNDDTNQNPHNPSFALYKAGLDGTLVTHIGSRAGGGGGNSRAIDFAFEPSFAANPVNNVSQAQSFVQAGLLAERLGPEKAKQVVEAAARVSQRHLASFNQQRLPEQYNTLLNCGYIGAKDLPGRISPDLLNPNLNPVYVGSSGVFGTAFRANTSDEKTAAVANLVYGGYAGGGTIELGGFDYHNNARAATDPRDFSAGQVVGQLIELAYRLNKKAFIYLYTDGGIGCAAENPQTVGRLQANGQQSTTETITKFQASSDDGNKGSTVVLFVNGQTPRGSTPILKSSQVAQGRQLGRFRDQNGRQGVDPTASLISNNVTNMSAAVILNYLALHGMENELSRIKGDNPFSAFIDRYVLFNRLV